MVRTFAALGLAIVIASSTMGCCSTCHSCGHGRPGYWRNWSAGKWVVGTACCRRCELCEDVGGPCGGWSQTSNLKEDSSSAPALNSDVPVEQPVPTQTSENYRQLPSASEVNDAEPAFRVSHHTLDRPR